MDWISLASTALGAVIALFAASMTERFRWQHEQTSNRRALRQETYARFQAALTDAHEQMRVQARADHPTPQDRYAAVHDAFRSSRCYHLRYETAIIAEQDVLDSAEESFQITRDLRDLLAEGGSTDSGQYKALRERYEDTFHELQRRIRIELGAKPVRLAGGS
jgi:hypothetical protein